MTFKIHDRGPSAHKGLHRREAGLGASALLAGMLFPSTVKAALASTVSAGADAFRTGTPEAIVGIVSASVLPEEREDFFWLGRSLAHLRQLLNALVELRAIGAIDLTPALVGRSYNWDGLGGMLGNPNLSPGAKEGLRGVLQSFYGTGWERKESFAYVAGRTQPALARLSARWGECVEGP
jgi:hypothetical protein